MRLTVNIDHFDYAAEKPVLRNFAFSLAKGETMSIVGMSGCGKSTMLRLISGILPKGEGNVFAGAIDVFGMSADAYRRTGKLAFMFQDSTLMPNRTVRENIRMPLEIRGIRDRGRVDELMETVGLHPFADYLPGQLSGGMKTRVALARSFVTEPELLLLDEPFAALDLTWKRELYQSLRDLVDRFHTTIIMVTHDLQEAVYNANKVFVMGQDGVRLDELLIDRPFPRPFDFNDTVSELTEHLHYLAKLLTDDAKRKRTGYDEALEAIQKVATFARNGSAGEEHLPRWLTNIRGYTNDPDINRLLLEAWRKKADKAFRFKIVWDILNYEDLSPQAHKEIAEFLIEHLQEFSDISAPFYGADPSLLLRALKQRIESAEVPNTKKWIYLCNLPSAEDKAGAKRLLQIVIQQRNPNFVYPLASEVAQKVLEAIEHNRRIEA